MDESEWSTEGLTVEEDPEREEGTIYYPDTYFKAVHAVKQPKKEATSTRGKGERGRGKVRGQKTDPVKGSTRGTAIIGGIAPRRGGDRGRGGSFKDRGRGTVERIRREVERGRGMAMGRIRGREVERAEEREVERIRRGRGRGMLKLLEEM